MKTVLMLTLAVAAGIAAGRGKRSADLTVHLANDVVPLAVMQDAKVRAAWMFADIGVRLTWMNEDPVPQSKVPSGVELRLHVVDRAVCKPDAMGCAYPYGGPSKTITVSYSTVKVGCQSKPGLEAKVLAHVMAHEIAHVLQGVDRHSETGIMKETWGENEYHAIWWKALRFTSQDIGLIRDGLKKMH